MGLSAHLDAARLLEDFDLATLTAALLLACAGFCFGQLPQKLLFKAAFPLECGEVLLLLLFFICDLLS